MITKLIERHKNNQDNHTLATSNTSRRVLRTCGYKIIQQAESQPVIEIPKSHQGRLGRLIHNIIEKQRQSTNQETVLFPRFQKLQHKKILTYRVRCACGQPFESNLELSHFEFKHDNTDLHSLNNIVLAYETLERWKEILPDNQKLSLELDCLIKRCSRCQQSAERLQFLILPKGSSDSNCQQSKLTEILEQLIAETDSIQCDLSRYINRLKNVKTLFQLKEELRSFAEDKSRLQDSEEECKGIEVSAQDCEQVKNKTTKQTESIRKILNSIGSMEIINRVHKVQPVQTKRIIYNTNTLSSEYTHHARNGSIQKSHQRNLQISIKVNTSRRKTKNSVSNLFVRSNYIQRSRLHHQEDLRKTQNLINTLKNMKNRYKLTVVESERNNQSIDNLNRNRKDQSQCTQGNQLQNVIKEVRKSAIFKNFIDLQRQDDDTECQKGQRIVQIQEIIEAIDRNLQKSINLVGESINQISALLQKYDSKWLVPLYLLYKKFFYMRCTFVATLQSLDSPIIRDLSSYHKTSLQNSQQYQQKIKGFTKENKQIYQSLNKMYSKVVKTTSDLDLDLLLIDMGDSQTTYNRFMSILLEKNIGEYVRIYKGIKWGRENVQEIESLGNYGFVIILACIDDMEKNQREMYLKLIQKWQLRYSQSTQYTIQSLVKQQKVALQRLQA